MAQNLMDSAQRQSSQVLIAQDDKGIVGYIESRQIGFLRHHLDRAAVLPEYRQQGIFTALLTEAVNRAGVSEISAEVSTNAPHLPTMERLEFKRVSQQGYMVNVVKPRKKIFGKF